MGFFPKTSRDLQRLDLLSRPPDFLVTGLMKLAVMAPAKRHSELITNLEADRLRLRKSEMMRI